MNKSFFNFIINFLQGASWALVVIVSAYLFFKMLPFGIFVAIFAALFGSFIGLFFVSFFELINIQVKSLSIKKEEIELLKEISKKLDKDSF